MKRDSEPDIERNGTFCRCLSATVEPRTHQSLPRRWIETSPTTVANDSLEISVLSRFAVYSFSSKMVLPCRCAPVQFAEAEWWLWGHLSTWFSCLPVCQRLVVTAASNGKSFRSLGGRTSSSSLCWKFVRSLFCFVVWNAHAATTPSSYHVNASLMASQSPRLLLLLLLLRCDELWVSSFKATDTAPISECTRTIDESLSRLIDRH